MRAIVRIALRHRHLACTDTSRRRCQFADQQGNCDAMSINRFSYPPRTGPGTRSSAEPRYSLLLSTDPDHIDAAQRLRYDVFSSEPGFALTRHDDGLDADRFDEHCDHILVREENSGELVGCYRMLSPTGADRGRRALHRNGIRHPGARLTTAVAGGDGSRGGAQRPPQRRRRAVDVGRHPGLPRPLRLRLRHRLRLGAGRGGRANHRAPRSAACATSWRAATPRRPNTGCTRTGR